MKKKFKGFLAPHGLYVLNTTTGEVRFISHETAINGEIAITDIPMISGNLELGPIPVQNHFSPIENEVIATYPYIIAKPFEDLIREEDPRMKCKLIGDTFTSILKYLALQLASEYIRATDVKDIQVHNILTKDLSRPLISSWNLMIARCLQVLEDNNVSLFTPEIKTAYEKLETKCKDPFLVTTSYTDENGEIKSKIKKLGKFQAIIHYRNNYSHGYNKNKTRAKQEFDQYFPLLCNILEEVRFISKYTLWHVESSRMGVKGIRLMGSSPTPKQVDFDRKGLNPQISPLFLLNEASSEILPLYAFFDVDNTEETGLPGLGKDVFVFNGNTKNTLIYLSSTGEYLEKTTRFQHWKELLNKKQLEVASINPKKITIEVLHAIGQHTSSVGIQALISSSKYLREATIPRKDLNEYLDSFSISSFNGFVLGGESGIGKSTLLAQKTEEWSSQGHMVTFYRTSSFHQSNISQKYLGDCSLKNCFFEDFLSLVNPIFTKAEKNCYLIIDALNEYTGEIDELINHLEILISQAKNFPWFKLIVSIRDSAYNRTTSKFGSQAKDQYYTIEEDNGNEKERTNFIRLFPISEEFVETLYNSYREYKQKDFDDPDSEGYYKFRPLTTFQELDPQGSTLKLLRSPIMARIIMQTFHRAKLPDSLSSYQAMQMYYENVVKEKNDNSLGFPERNKFLKLLAIEFDKNSLDRIERDEIYRNQKLQVFFISNKKGNTYDQLLDLGVLMEEWEEDNCYVQFAFDKLFEFLLAEIYWPKIINHQELLNLCKRANNYKPLFGVCENIIIRFCINNDQDQLLNLIKNAEKQSEKIQIIVKELSVICLENLSRENYEIFEQIINKFIYNPKNIDLEILDKLIENFYLTGNLKGFEKTIIIANEEANELNDKRFTSDLLLFSAQLDLLQGRYQKARTQIENSISQKKELNDIKGELIGYTKLGHLEWELGKIETAKRIWKRALRISKKNNNKKLTAIILNNLGNIFKLNGELDKAGKMYLEALKTIKELNTKQITSPMLNNIGIIYQKKGELDKAEKMYFEALQASHEIGHKIEIKNSYINIGSINSIKGNLEIAEKMYFKALEISKSIDDVKGIIDSLISIGIIYYQNGELDNSEKRILEAIEISKKYEIKRKIQICLNNLGVIQKAKGDLDGAIKSYYEAFEISKETENKNGNGAILNNIGNIYKEKNDLNMAIKTHLEALEKSLEINDKQEVSNSLNNIGNIYTLKGELDNAEKTYMKSLEISKEIGDKKGISSRLNNLANIFEQRGDLDKAEQLYLESLEFSKEIDDRKEISIRLHNIGNIFKQKGELEKAEKFHIESLEISKEIGDTKVISANLKNLNSLYKQKGDLENAETMQLEAFKIKNELYDK